MGPCASEGSHQQSLQEYANERMDREMDTRDKGSRTEDVDLWHSTYELTRDLGPSAFRDKISVLNITDEILTVLVLPLSYGDETLGRISARLATPEPAQIRWAMQEAAKRDSAALCSVNPRSDLVLYDGLNVNVSEVLLVVTKFHEHHAAVSVLDARRVAATENVVLAVLPGLLWEGSGAVPALRGALVKAIVEEILDRMIDTPRVTKHEKDAPPPIKVRMALAGGHYGSRRVYLDAKLHETMGSIRRRLGARGVDRLQDMYICHNGKLLGDCCVLSDLEFWEYRGLSPTQDHLVLSMHLLPGRVNGRLSHIPESGRAFGSTPSLSEMEVSFCSKEATLLSLATHPLCSVRHLKIHAMHGDISFRAGWNQDFGREHADFYFCLSSRPLMDESCPLDFFSAELLRNDSNLSVYLSDTGGVSLKIRRQLLGGFWTSPQWPWKRITLPLEEREFNGKETNDFDVRTFKKYSSKVVFVNRTSRPVHISCFPTWSKDRRVRKVGFHCEACGLGLGASMRMDNSSRYLPGYGAVEDPCLAAFGAYETVNIANGMVREMSVVFGVESEDGCHVEYKRLKNVKGGQQVDVLEAFVQKPPKYIHLIGQTSKDALEAHFLPKA